MIIKKYGSAANTPDILLVNNSQEVNKSEFETNI